MTSMEREDKEKGKKREKKLEEEEMLQQATWVKYTIPIKHQVKPPRLTSAIQVLFYQTQSASTPHDIIHPVTPILH